MTLSPLIFRKVCYVQLLYVSGILQEEGDRCGGVFRPPAVGKQRAARKD